MGRVPILIFTASPVNFVDWKQWVLRECYAGSLVTCTSQGTGGLIKLPSQPCLFSLPQKGSQWLTSSPALIPLFMVDARPTGTAEFPTNLMRLCGGGVKVVCPPPSPGLRKLWSAACGWVTVFLVTPSCCERSLCQSVATASAD